MKIGDKIYWLSWDGKTKGEYTIKGIIGHKDGYLKGKFLFNERKKPLGEVWVITEIDEHSRFRIHEKRRYFSNELTRKIFEERVQPYL